MRYDLKHGSYNILKLLCIYYSAYGLLIFFGSGSTYDLQNPNIPFYFKLIDEILIIILSLHIVFF